MLWFNYLASFSDGVQKVGITSRPFHRLQSWLLEATRHDLRVEHFELSEPLASRDIALHVKAHILETFSEQALPGHRSWFRYAPVGCEVDGEQGWRELLTIPHAMRSAAEIQNPLNFASTAMQYYRFCEFAHELAVNGKLIRPATAARLAQSLVAPSDQLFAESEALHRKVEGQSEQERQLLLDEYSQKKERRSIDRIKAVLA